MNYSDNYYNNKQELTVLEGYDLGFLAFLRHLKLPPIKLPPVRLGNSLKAVRMPSASRAFSANTRALNRSFSNVTKGLSRGVNANINKLTKGGSRFVQHNMDEILKAPGTLMNTAIDLPVSALQRTFESASPLFEQAGQMFGQTQNMQTEQTAEQYPEETTSFEFQNDNYQPVDQNYDATEDFLSGYGALFDILQNPLVKTIGSTAADYFLPGSGGIVNALADNTRQPAKPSIRSRSVNIPVQNATKNLVFGSRGEYVRVWQTTLNSLGYSMPVDSQFGTITKNKTIQFQRDNGLQADGIVGPATRAKAKELLTNGSSLPMQNAQFIPPSTGIEGGKLLGKAIMDMHEEKLLGKKTENPGINLQMTLLKIAFYGFAGYAIYKHFIANKGKR